MKNITRILVQLLMELSLIALLISFKSAVKDSKGDTNVGSVNSNNQEG